MSQNDKDQLNPSKLMFDDGTNDNRVVIKDDNGVTIGKEDAGIAIGSNSGTLNPRVHRDDTVLLN